MNSANPETEILLKEYTFIQERIEKNNRLIYQTLYLSIIYGGVILNPIISSFLDPNQMVRLAMLSIPSGFVFFGLSGMLSHFRHRRTYLMNRLRLIENRIVPGYEPVNFNRATPQKKKVNAKMLQFLYMLTGALFLIFPIVRVLLAR